MKSEKTNKHRLTTADIITLLRIAGTLALVFLRPFSAVFFCVYVLTGLTDALDGFVARITHTQSSFGAKLDSVADLIFYAVIIIKIFPYLLSALPISVWYIVAAALVIRISAYLVAMIKYRLFASTHTYLNKLTGLSVFLIPFMFITQYATLYCYAAAIIGAVASLEELLIHLIGKKYNENTKSIFQKTAINNKGEIKNYENPCD